MYYVVNYFGQRDQLVIKTNFGRIEVVFLSGIHCTSEKLCTVDSAQEDHLDPPKIGLNKPIGLFIQNNLLHSNILGPKILVFITDWSPHPWSF